MRVVLEGDSLTSSPEVAMKWEEEGGGAKQCKAQSAASGSLLPLQVQIQIQMDVGTHM